MDRSIDRREFLALTTLAAAGTGAAVAVPGVAAAAAPATGGFVQVAEGLQFVEGPVAMADGSVIVVEMRRKTLTCVGRDGKHTIIAELGGGPNGAAVGPDGALYVCNNGGSFTFQPGEVNQMGPPPARYTGGSIQKVDLATGKFRTLYESCDGKPLNGPNDLVFDGQGGFWFTTLGQSDGEVRRMGAVYYAKADGSHIKRWRSEMFSPNGVGLSPDGRRLYVNDCNLGRLWGFDVVKPGEMKPEPTPPAAPGDVLATLPGYQWLDSLKVEQGGRICSATLFNPGITVFEPNGRYEHVSLAALGDPVVTNLCFGGADMRDVWVTCSSSGKLFKGRWPRPGLKLAYNA